MRIIGLRLENEEWIIDNQYRGDNTEVCQYVVSCVSGWRVEVVNFDTLLLRIYNADRSNTPRSPSAIFDVAFRYDVSTVVRSHQVCCTSMLHPHYDCRSTSRIYAFQLQSQHANRKCNRCGTSHEYTDVTSAFSCTL